MKPATGKRTTRDGRGQEPTNNDEQQGASTTYEYIDTYQQGHVPARG
jgi:hypothetical protein